MHKITNELKKCLFVVVVVGISGRQTLSFYPSKRSTDEWKICNKYVGVKRRTIYILTHSYATCLGIWYAQKEHHRTTEWTSWTYTRDKRRRETKVSLTICFWAFGYTNVSSFSLCVCLCVSLSLPPLFVCMWCMQSRIRIDMQTNTHRMESINVTRTMKNWMCIACVRLYVYFKIVPRYRLSANEKMNEWHAQNLKNHTNVSGNHRDKKSKENCYVSIEHLITCTSCLLFF